MNEGQQSRHERRRQKTRNQLQNAMLELVLDKGFDAITIQEITDRADLGRGTFYFHFHSKEDALWTIVEDRIHMTELQVEEGFEGVLPEQPEYFGYVNIFKHVELNKQVYRVIVGSKGSQEVANRAKQYMLDETIRDMERFGIYQEIGQPTEITAQIVVGLIIGLVYWWLENRTDYSAEDLAAIVYRTLHHRDPPVDAEDR